MQNNELVFWDSAPGHNHFFYPAGDARPLPKHVSVIRVLPYAGDKNRLAVEISKEDAIALGTPYKVIWLNKEPT